MTYNWAMNPAKLGLAIANAGSGASEEAIKTEYIKLAGLVRGAKPDDWKASTPKKEVTIDETHSATPEDQRPRRGRATK